VTAIDTLADRTALAAVIGELESRSGSQFRTLHEPAVMAELRAIELGDAELAHRAMLLQGSVLLREGRSAEGGYRARRVLDWAVLHDNHNLLARAHREMAVFHRQVGDLADALRHAVQGVANLPDDAAPELRARHLISLAVALDETGPPARRTAGSTRRSTWPSRPANSSSRSSSSTTSPTSPMRTTTRQAPGCWWPACARR
jgi:two-component system cell cycle response regulator